MLRLRAGLAGLAALVLASTAGGTTLVFNFSGEIDGGTPGFTANVTAIFDFDPSCVGTDPSFCGLRITLRYNATAGVPSQGESLSGLLWEPLGSADFRDGPPGNLPFGGVVGAESLVGNGNVIAAGELGNVTINGSSYLNVSSHWGLNPAVAINSTVAPGFGSHFLGSVGDILASIPGATSSTLSSMQMFGNNPSSIEPSPPDGSRFAILDVNSIPNGGFPSGNLAYVQDEIVANVFYTGQLSGVNLVQPLFGTEGNPMVPEPGGAALLGLALVGALGAVRRLRS